MTDDIHIDFDGSGVKAATAALESLEVACRRAAEALSEPIFPPKFLDYQTTPERFPSEDVRSDWAMVEGAGDDEEA